MGGKRKKELKKIKEAQISKNPTGYDNRKGFLMMDGKDNTKQLSRVQQRSGGNQLTDAQLYLKECSYTADLKNMYHFDENYATCVYNQQMEYTPVQIKVND